MNLLESFKRLFNNKNIYFSYHEEEKPNIKSYHKKFENLISEASYIIDSDDVSSNDVHPIFIFIKQITDYITLENSLNSYEKVDTFRANVLKKVLLNSQEKYIKKIIVSNIDDESRQYYEDHGIKVLNEYICFNYSNSPIIINPWNMRRTSDALVKVATQKNKFDSIKYNYNIVNTYYYPLGYIICYNGNHSQYSAKLKNEGTVHISQFDDITSLYEYVDFDGNSFNYSFPDLDSSINFIRYEVETEQEFYIGVLFEIGRLMMDKKNLFPKQIQKLIQ